MEGRVPTGLPAPSSTLRRKWLPAGPPPARCSRGFRNSVEALREYTAGLPLERTGWLAALRDPAIGRALARMHAHIAHPWTTETLAAEALLSRSAFADRFTQLLDVPPMSYLTRWRMRVAAQRLRETVHPISQIAADVGYECEATFTRAFKREMGRGPGQYRRSR